ncbi:unnamed protein product [Lactuca saligna]|uniref:DUF4283 domain-containing protein n=1 Tax=Lactuca saligna TaxID=75948 RepID=A0AA35YZ93_LACSI|nr:unnamed protein product [Lactuca saligna]
MGSYHIFASITWFNRVVSKNGRENSQGQVNRSVSQGHGNRSKSEEHMGRPQVHVHVQSGSFANAVKGDTSANEKKKPVSVVWSLQGTKIDNPLSIQSSIFGKLRDIRLISKLCILLKEEGFPMSIIKSVVNGFYVKERTIWLEMLCLPCCSWNDATVKNIANIWGDVYFLEEDENAPLAETDMMEAGDIDSDIPDLLGDEEEDVCFDEDEIKGRNVKTNGRRIFNFSKVKDEEKVNEGHGDSFGTDNMHSKGDRGVGFLDRKGGFFQTNIKRKGNEVVDGGSSSFVDDAAPVTDVNQSEPSKRVKEPIDVILDWARKP